MVKNIFTSGAGRDPEIVCEHLHRYLDMTSAFFPQRERYSLLLETAQDLGSTELELQAQLGLARAHFRLGNISTARALYEQSLELSHELGNRYGEASSLLSLGLVEIVQGNYSSARGLFEQSLAMRRELCDLSGEAYSLNNLGIVEHMLGNSSAARALYGQSLVLSRELGVKPIIVVSCACAGAVLAALGRPQVSALALHGAQHCAASLGFHFEPDDLQVLDSGLARLDEAIAAGEISVDKVAALKAKAEGLSIEELVDMVLAALADAKAENGGEPQAKEG